MDNNNTLNRFSAIKRKLFGKEFNKDNFVVDYHNEVPNSVITINKKQKSNQETPKMRNLKLKKNKRFDMKDEGSERIIESSLSLMENNVMRSILSNDEDIISTNYADFSLSLESNYNETTDLTNKKLNNKKSHDQKCHIDDIFKSFKKSNSRLNHTLSRMKLNPTDTSNYNNNNSVTLLKTMKYLWFASSMFSLRNPIISSILMRHLNQIFLENDIDLDPEYSELFCKNCGCFLNPVNSTYFTVPVQKNRLLRKKVRILRKARPAESNEIGKNPMIISSLLIKVCGLCGERNEFIGGRKRNDNKRKKPNVDQRNSNANKFLTDTSELLLRENKSRVDPRFVGRPVFEQAKLSKGGIRSSRETRSTLKGIKDLFTTEKMKRTKKR